MAARRRVATALTTAVVLGITACSGTDAPEAGADSESTSTGTAPSTSTARPGPPHSTEPTTAPTTKPTDDQTQASPGVMACARRHLSRLDRAEQAAQLVMIGVPSDAGGVPAAAAHALGDLGIGGVILTGRTQTPLTDVRTLTTALQQQAARSPAGLGLEISTDQEGGQVQALSGPGFSAIPSALDQGQLTPKALETAARRWGSELARAGVTLDLAPVVDVVPTGTDNEPIGLYDREFGHTPGAVAQDGAAFVRGMAAAGVATSIKHFPGLGRASGNTDTSAGVVDDVTTRNDPFLAPFAAGIRAGSAYVMMSTATYTRLDPAHIAAFSPTVVDVLRDRLGYDGVVISDDLGIAASVSDIPVGQRAVRFVAAGGDVALTVVPEQGEAMVHSLARRASQSLAFRDRLAAAVTRVLVRKVRAGLASCG